MAASGVCLVVEGVDDNATTIITTTVTNHEIGVYHRLQSNDIQCMLLMSSHATTSRKKRAG